MKSHKKWGVAIVGVVIFAVLINHGINLFFDWYAYRHWVPRQTSQSTYSINHKADKKDLACNREAVKRGVFERKMKYTVTPDSLQKYLSAHDTLFYIERGFRLGVHSAEVTRKITYQETDYPYQLVAKELKIRGGSISFQYFTEDNPNIADTASTNRAKVFLKSVENDTIRLRVIQQRWQPTPRRWMAGEVKLF